MTDWAGPAHPLRIARQFIQHLEPRKLFRDMHMRGRRHQTRIGQRAMIQMHFVGDTVSLIRDRRAAPRTEATSHAGGGLINPRRALRETKCIAKHAGERRDRRRPMPPATVTVAMKQPIRRTHVLVTDVAAQTAPARDRLPAHSVAPVPRITVLCADSTPPLPCTIAVSHPATWRCPHSPRNCRTASISRNSPYIPGWQ